MPNNEEVIIKTKDVLVRIIELGPYEQGRWHYHSEVVDTFFYFTGSVSVFLKDPDEEVVLGPGKRFDVLQGRVHQATNTGAENARYLLAIANPVIIAANINQVF